MIKAKGPQLVLLPVVAIILFIEIIKYIADVKSLIRDYKFDLFFVFLSKVSLDLILYLIVISACILFVILPIVVIVQRRFRWEYTDTGATEITKSNEKFYFYEKMLSISIFGKHRIFVNFDNSPNLPKVESTSWYGTDQTKLFELIEFLISKKSDIRNKIYIQNYSGKMYYPVPADKWKETLTEYFSSVKFN